MSLACGKRQRTENSSLALSTFRRQPCRTYSRCPQCEEHPSLVGSDHIWPYAHVPGQGKVPFTYTQPTGLTICDRITAKCKVQEKVLPALETKNRRLQSLSSAMIRNCYELRLIALPRVVAGPQPKMFERKGWLSTTAKRRSTS